jgi:hypothetical protein
MLNLKRLTLGLMISALVLCGFLAGRAVAQQPIPVEQRSPYSFPRSWGDLRDVTQSTAGYSFTFVNSGDGTIRLVVANSAGIVAIQAIHRN